MTEQTDVAQTGPEATRETQPYVPLTDIYENKEALVIVAEMPGVDAGDVDISVENRVLIISGRSTAHQPDGYTEVHTEYRDVDYERSFTLSDAVDTKHVDAAMKDGLLRLSIPKSGPEPAKKIAVKKV